MCCIHPQTVDSIYETAQAIIWTVNKKRESQGWQIQKQDPNPFLLPYDKVSH